MQKLTLFFAFFRYYFKKVSDEFDCGVVFEEVREDDAILPIFEEKIIGKVEKIDWSVHVEEEGVEKSQRLIDRGAIGWWSGSVLGLKPEEQRRIHRIQF